MSNRLIPKQLGRLLLAALLFALPASATVTVSAHLTDPSGSPASVAYVRFELTNCGFNVPAVPSQPLSVVWKHIDVKPDKNTGLATATIFGNDEIMCGGSQSSLWHVTAYSDANSAIAGDKDYLILASLGSWEFSAAQPFTGNRPPPGFQSVFANPVANQTIVQPAGTSLAITGTFDLTNATVIGFTGSGSGGSGIGISINGSNVGASALNFGQTPAAPTGALNVTWQRDALNPANASAYIAGATSSTLGLLQLGGDFCASATAASPTICSLHLTAPLGFNQGGTNATSAATAFNNLAPSTAQGGLIIATGANAYGNLPLGTTGKVLTSNGTTVVWSTPAAGSIAAGTTSRLVRYSDGINSVLGNAAASDDGTTTTVPVLVNPNQGNVLHVGGGITTWAGSDIGAQINSAYAALPATGGEIDIHPQASGACYSYSTTITFATLGKLPLVRFLGGACLNYTPTTATNAIFLDYAPTNLTPHSSHGFDHLLLYNNGCITTGGCGSSAVGIMVGNTNAGHLDATMDRPSIYGFGVAYQNLNPLSVQHLWVAPTIAGNSVGMFLGALTGFELHAGTVGGNNVAIETDTTGSIEMSVFGTQFFSNGLIIDATRNTSTAAVDFHDAHLENQGNAGENMVTGNIDVHMFGGLIVDDNLTAGTGDWFFNLTGNQFDMFGTEVLCGRTTMTQAFTVAASVRSNVNAYFGNTRCSAVVGGAGSAKATVLARLPGGSASTPWSIESQLQLANGAQVTSGTLSAAAGGSVDFSTSPTVVNSTTGTGSPNNTTCTQTGQEYFQTDGTAGQEKWFCKAGVWSQQLNSGAGGASVTLNNLTTTAINADLLPSGTRHLGATTAPWADIFIGSASGNTLKLTGTFTANRVATFPDATDTVAEIGQSQTFSGINIFSGNLFFTRLISQSTGAPTTSCVLCFGSADRARYGTNNFNLVGVTSASSPVQLGDTPGVSLNGPVTTVSNGQSITVQPLAAATNSAGGNTSVSGGAGNGTGANGDVVLAAGSGGAAGTGFVQVNSGATVPCANAPGGTSTNSLVSYSSVGCVNTPHGSTLGIAGICVEGCGISGTAKIARLGAAPLLLDNAGTQGDYVCISSSADGKGSDCGTSPTTQTVGTVQNLLTGSTYNVDVNVAGVSNGSSTGSVVLAPGANQTIQGTAPTVPALTMKAPASAGGSQVIAQMVDNTGTNVFNCTQSNGCQAGSGVGGSITLSHIVGPNSNPAGTGIVEASNGDVIFAGRNAANNADLTATLNASDILAWSAKFQALGLITTTAPVIMTEIAAPSGTASSLVNWGDSTTHWPSFNPNNVGAFKYAPISQVNTQSGTTYTVLVGDLEKVVNFTNGSAIAVTLLNSTGVFGTNFCFYANAGGAGTVTITPTTATINGAASLALTSGQFAKTCADGAGNYTALVSSSGGGSGDMIKNAANVMGASGTLNGAAMSVTAGLTFPKGAGANPTGDGIFAQDTTLHLPVFGNGTSTRVFGGSPVNSQSGTTYTVLTTDCNKALIFGNASPVAVTLPQAGASFPNGCFFYVSNTLAGLVTITPTTSTIDAAASVTLSNGQSYCIVSNGTNYFTQCKGAQSGLGDPGSSAFVARTSANVTAARTLTGTANQISVTNGTGAAGDPVFSIDTTHVATDTNSLTLTNKTQDAEGTGNVFTRPFYIEFTPGCNNNASGPGAFDVPTSGGSTFTCFGTTTTLGAADFVDAATSTATGHFNLPQGWTGNMDVRISWFANAASANAVRWSVQTGCAADGDAISTGPSYNAASASNTAYTGTANQRKTTLLSAVAMTNCSAGETMFFQVQRIGADGGDTLAATAEALSVQFEGRATK